jgi:hypothetical protein
MAGVSSSYSPNVNVARVIVPNVIMLIFNVIYQCNLLSLNNAVKRVEIPDYF